MIQKAQATLEFTLAMIGAILLLVGMIRVFTWVGMGMAGQIRAHEEVLTMNTTADGNLGPLRQMREHFFTPPTLNAAVSSNVFYY